MFSVAPTTINASEVLTELASRIVSDLPMVLLGGLVEVGLQWRPRRCRDADGCACCPVLCLLSRKEDYLESCWNSPSSVIGFPNMGIPTLSLCAGAFTRAYSLLGLQ